MTKASGDTEHEFHYEMEVHYFRQIEGVEVEFGPTVRPAIPMMAHVQIIIWGALMVESFANRFRRAQLTEQVSSIALGRLWKRHVAREKTLEKLNNASRRFAGIAPPSWLDGELQLRDRLAHFKDEPIRDSPSRYLEEWEAAGKPGELMDFLPPMGIHADLLETPIETRKNRFLEYGQTLYKASEEARKIRGRD